MATFEEWQADLQRQIAADREAELQRRATEEQAWLEEQQRKMAQPQTLAALLPQQVAALTPQQVTAAEQKMSAMQQQGAQPIPLSNLINDYGSQNEARRLSNYGGPEQAYLPQSVGSIDPYAERNARLSALLTGTPTEGRWTQGESGRPMLTMVGKGDAGFQSLGKYATPQEFINAAPDVFAKVNPDLVGKYKQQSPQEIALADLSRQAMDVLQNPNATIAQKQAAFKLMQPPGTSLADQKTQAEIQKLQAETEKARRGEPTKSEWGTVESGGKIYQINKNTGEMRPATVDGEQLVGKEGKKTDPVAKKEGALSALTTAGYDPETDQDQVEALIKKSTSGGLQKGGAATARFFDVTTEGGKAIQALKTISNSITMDLLNGKLGAGISNADVAFLQKTLGDVGNEDLTADERLSAWKQARSRIKSFAGIEKSATSGKQQTGEVRYRLRSPGLDPRLKSSYEAY